MYNAIIWNARGVGNNRTLAHLKDLVVRYKPSIIVIIEPKINHRRIDQIARSIGFDNYAHGDEINNRIWIMWTAALEVTNFLWRPYQVTVSITTVNSDSMIYYTFVHAPCVFSDQQVVWDEIVNLSSSFSMPWIVAGDFNAISSWDEKKGGNRDGDESIQSFNLFMMQAGLIDIGYHGNDYTWSNNQTGNARIWERLDRALVNNHAMVSLPNFRLDHLQRVIHSDHCPILLHLKDEPPRKALFRFQKCWAKHPSFENFIMQNWSGILHAEPMTNFGRKLHRLRPLLRQWNWHVFGNLNTRSRNLLTQISTLEAELQNHWTEHVARELHKVKVEHSDIQADQTDMLRAKARLDWMKEGDRNTKFFHTAIRIRNQTGQVRLHQQDGSYTDHRSVIGKKAVEFFDDLFNGYSPPPPPDELSLIQPIISETSNESLTIMPDEEEIRMAISDMNCDSAPGPDGFTGHFYNQCWNIIKEDLIKAIQSFFRGHPIPSSWSATHLMLLPKAPNVSNMAQMRPISLCNFNHKIISHILMKRMSPILPVIISEEQTGFVPGRKMHDNIALAHDLVHDLDRKVDGGNVIIKLDMAKAYDRLSWSFLIRILRAMGFSERWCDLIFRCISNCRYSVKWEGEIFGYFKSTRGVRQGDPLSPSLFIVAMEWFSKYLNDAMISEIILPYRTLHRAINISHLMFADDLLVFSNGKLDSIMALLDLLGKFCILSGEKLNPSKSQIIFSNGIDNISRDEICDITGFKATLLPITYLGVPLYKGRTLVCHFQYLRDRMQKRIMGWAKRLLSMGGRIEIVRSVLSAMSIHAMLTLPVPLTVIDSMVTIMSAFIWDTNGESRRHWISGTRLCTPKECGGLAIRHPRLMMQTFHAKRAWDFVISDSLWARFARSRFREGQSGSPLWNAISPFITNVKSLGTWKLGNGNTACGDIGLFYGISVPSYIRYSSVRSIMNNPGCISALRDSVPPEEQHVFETVIFNDQEDRFVSKLTVDGSFTIKAYYNHLVDQSNRTRYPWGTIIWRSWIPPKISCLLWKLYHNVVPTDEAITKLGLSIVSKCTCCTAHTRETATHLFFEGELASSIWSRLAAIFDRPRPHGKGSLLRFWLKGDMKDYMDNLASGMAGCVLWELWKARNDKIFNDTHRPSWRNCLSWAVRINAMIKSPFIYSFQTQSTIAALGIFTRPTNVRIRWLSWRPPDTDCAIDIYFIASEITRVSGIVRNQFGHFIMAAVQEYSPSSHLAVLAIFLQHILSSQTSLHTQIKFIRSSHDSFWDIRYADNYEIRRIRNMFHGIQLSRIAPRQNMVAMALSHTQPPGTYRTVSELSRPVRHALISDGFLSPSTSLIDVEGTNDDSAYSHPPYVTPHNNDGH